ncbi:hypothetical protein LINPERPRIM_LOCUS31451 [Linum perenne]
MVLDPMFLPDRKMKMPRETSPGLKILWFWTLGTVVVLVTTVVRTRLRGMEQLMNAKILSLEIPS